MSEAHFVDTSALVKRYIRERGSRPLRDRCFADGSVEIFVAPLTYAEMYATFFRLVREGDLTTVEIESVLTSFEGDWQSFVTVEHGPFVRRHVPELARTHALRGADLVQLASAVHLRSLRALDLFVACDLRLANAATAIGLPVFNPEID